MITTKQIVLVLALGLIFTVAGVSLPNCQTSSFFKVLPLVPQETFMVDLSELFTGYNLRFNVTADVDIQKYIKISDKTMLLKEEYPDVPLQGLKNYHLAKIGNSWGQQFIVLTERGDKSLVHYGILSDNRTVPVINNYITVENFTNTTCFDAQLLPKSNVILVDCAQRRTSNNTRGQIYQNIFYYFRISDGVKVKEVKTEMYVPFQQLTSRKLDIYQDSESSHTYILRTYFALGMTDARKDNTYLQVLMMQDPFSPWVVGIIDRSFLGLPKLRITDVKVYLGQIYILDYLLGVHRVYISGASQFQYQGTYEAKGFSKMAVFSPNLDNRIELALANDHKVHEIDWTDVDEPRLLNKYSLLPDSLVIQLFLNERFLFVRSSASDGTANYNYTWVFTRGDRTFSRAFAIMSHGSSNTFIDVNEERTYMIVINDQAIANYAFDDPSFTLQFDQNEQLLNTLRSFTISATSNDPNLPAVNVSCAITLNFTLLDPNNRTMWEVGTAPPSKFSANYPGQVKLELGEYILGPNVTYRIRENEKGELKNAKVYQQEQLVVKWEQMPPFNSITFLQTETISGKEQDVLMIYTQDNQNKTFIVQCHPRHRQMEVSCNKTEVKDLGGKITNWATTIVKSPYTEVAHHLLAFTTGTYYNTIFIEDLTSGGEVAELMLGNGFPGNISSLTITGKYMFAVLRHIKRINIYMLDQCLEDNCYAFCNINHMSMYRLGVLYFAPLTVHSSRFHPDILFIKTSDSIIAVDLSKECVPKLLSIIYPVENATVDFVFEVNSDFLVVTIAPNIIQQYDISRIYLRQVRKTKKYPLYGYKLPRNYQFDISDYGNCVYLSTVTEGGDYNIFVYRSGLPAVGSLYNQIDLFAFQNILIDASGYVIDYVTVITTKQMRLFRQYEKAEAEIQNPSKDYSFYLQYLNAIDSAELEKVEVTIINLPTYITVNPFLKDIMNTKDFFYSGENKLSEVDDRDWYQGNVLYIQSDCKDCPSKIRVNNHIQRETSAFIVPSLTSYVYTKGGGEALAASSLLRFKPNGTVSEIVNFESSSFRFRYCMEVAVGTYGFTVAGCILDDVVYLQIVSKIATKGLPFSHQETTAKNLIRLQSEHELVMLVDADSDCYRKKRGGGVFLYAISTDMQGDDPLDEIEYIDGDDFGMRELGTLYFNNAELVYDKSKSIYRLYITEMNRGLLIMQFTYSSGNFGIVVRQTYFVQIREMLQKLGQSLPYDATFQAITLMSTFSNNTSRRTTDKLLITTGRYHTIQLSLDYDNTFNLINKTIERLYLRYSYYEVSNDIKENGQLFIIRQTLPQKYNHLNQTQQLYTIYSTEGQFNGTIQSRGLIGALPLVENTPHRFDFNTTLDYSDQHSEPRLGVIVVEEGGELVKASLHRNLSVFTTELLDTQIIFLDLVNDFNLQKIRVLINGRAPFPEWKLITIILFSIIGGILLIGALIFGIKKWQSMIPGEQRETLLTQETNVDQN